MAEGLLGLVRGLRAAAVGFEPEALSGEDCAVATGELSLAQVQEVVKTEIACPGSGAEMLRTARTQSLKTLKEEARNRRVGSIDPEELHSLQHQAKTFRWWKTKLGNIGFTGEIPPEAGVPIVNRLEAETDRLWQEAKRTADSGVEPGSAAERRSALAADAFVRLVATGGRGKARAADLIIVCDLRAYRRGHVEDGEVCHIIGGGPIPVSLARELGRDAFLKAVLHDGVRIDTVAHFGRKCPAVLRTALELGPPPAFAGVECARPHCDRRHHLEFDHIDPVANRGPTALANLEPLCWPHHRAKTEQDRRAGLLGPTTGPDPP